MSVHRDTNEPVAVRRDWRLKWSRRVVTAAFVVAVMSVATPAAHATDARPVTHWIARHAQPLATVDPTAPLDDWNELRRSIGNAEIVGLGESVHGAAEEITLKHRALRFLVEELGFRSIAWEEDWAVGRQIDRYIRGGEGRLDALVAKMSSQWQSREVADVLHWLREYNADRTDQVRFVGVEYYLTGQTAYDDIDRFVAARAPERRAELRDLLEPLRPATPDVYQHIQWYTSVPDKAPYIRRAREIVVLLEALPHGGGDDDELMVQQARQIVSFYEHFSLTDAEALVFRDARAAANVAWWRNFSGDKIVYWAASPHTASAPDLRIADPPAPDMRFRSAGSYLRQRYGQEYRSIGFTFDHGALSLGPGQTVTARPPARGWFERPLGELEVDQFFMDLRARAPAPVRHWLNAPITTRGLPDGGADAHMYGGALAEWFDVVVHRQSVTPVTPP